MALAAPLILVIGDDPDILQVYVGALELEGFPVLCAQNAFDGVGLASAQQPDLVLLDLHLPRVNGGWLADALRRRGISTTIVLITADRNAKQWAEEHKADAFLEKPFDLGELIELVRGRLMRSA